MRPMRLIKCVVFFSLFCVSVSAQDAANIPPPTSQTKTPLATVCAVANFGDPNVPGTPLYSADSSALVQDAQGNIYSTTPDGGKFRKGAAYKVSPDGKMTVLYDFGQPLKNFPKKDPKDPDVYLSGPSGGLVKYGNNSFIGVSGGGELKVGAIFSIPASGGEPTILYSFRNGIPARKLNPGEKDYTPQEKLDWAAGYPTSAPVAIGNSFYGVTPYADNQRYGIYYGFSGGYAGKYYFTGENGYRPWNLIAGGDGKLYGITIQGTTKATYYMGVVFSAGPGGGTGTGGGTRTPVAMAAPTTGGAGQTSSSASGGGSGVKLLYEGGPEGSGPVSLIYGSDKQLYVAMASGGKGGSGGLGSIMKFDPVSGKHEVIHYFEGYNTGSRPASIVEGPDGKLYGATLGGGHCGGFYSLSKDGKDFKMLFLFDHDRIGHLPRGPLLVDASKKYIYGTTYQVGPKGAGSLYRVEPPFEPLPWPADPGRRWCCALGQTPVSGFSGGPLDPVEIVGHKYGTSDNKSNMFGTRDPVGFVATAYGGLVDIGHVRYTADMTKYVYDLLIQGEKLIPLFESNAEILKAPADQYAALELAGAIAYHEAWVHELGTWKVEWSFDTDRDKWIAPPQDFSSFSPEDLSSNLVGIEVAKRAIINSCAAKDFDAAMDEQLPIMLKELKAQPKEVTAKILDGLEQSNFETTVQGKWFKENAGKETLLRRNFEHWPWRVVEDKSNYTHPMFSGTSIWSQSGNFKSKMKGHIIGHEMDVTSYNMKAATALLKKMWVEGDKDDKDRKGLATWP